MFRCLLIILILVKGTALAQTAVVSAQTKVTITISTSGPVTVSSVGFYYNNAAGALTFNLPVITLANIGYQFCFRNSVTRTGAITIQSPAATYIDVDGTNGTAAGTLVSAGALGDSACIVAVSVAQYVAYTNKGTWTNN